MRRNIPPKLTIGEITIPFNLMPAKTIHLGAKSGKGKSIFNNVSATHVSDIDEHSIFVHLYPAPEFNEVKDFSSISTDIYILITSLGSPDLRCIVPYLKVVDGVVGERITGELPHTPYFSEKECHQIDLEICDVLFKKYNLSVKN